MRTLKLQVQTTVDGYMAGPDGEMDWMTFPWTEDIEAYVDALTRPVDGIVLGRKLAEGFIPHWASQPEGEPQEAIDWMNQTPKIVISNTLTESPWENAVIAGGDVAQAVAGLKAQSGGDLIAYGGSTLVSSLIAAGLADELHLFVNPSAIGAGLPVFPDVGAPSSCPGSVCTRSTAGSPPCTWHRHAPDLPEQLRPPPPLIMNVRSWSTAPGEHNFMIDPVGHYGCRADR